MAYLPRGVEPVPELPQNTAEADLDADITISDILDAHDKWQTECPDDPDAIHRLVDERWADKRGKQVAKRVDVG
jgi:hypothetical protein